MRLLSYILAMWMAAPALASEVLAVSGGRKNIAVAHDPKSPWVTRDRACVVQNQTDVVCGTVTKTTVKGAIVALDTTFDGVSIGDLVRKIGGGRRPTAETVETFNSHQTKTTFDLTLGMGVGLSFFYPMLHLQVALSPHFTLGVQPLYYKASGGNTAVSAFGGMLTANYYKDPYYNGLWICGGVGTSSVSVEDLSLGLSEKANSMLGMLTVGWRGRWASGWNAGIAGGIQYLGDPAFTTIVIKSAGVQPLLTLDFGYNF